MAANNSVEHACFEQAQAVPVKRMLGEEQLAEHDEPMQGKETLSKTQEIQLHRTELVLKAIPVV